MLFTTTATFANEGKSAINSASKGYYNLSKNKKNKQVGKPKTGIQGKRIKERNENRNGDKGRKSPGYAAVTGISLSKTSTTLAVNSWERLAATVHPANAKDKKYYWFSSNPRVVSVNSSGKITGVAPGTAVIYVATRDGFKTASCSVTVEGQPMASPVRVTGIGLSSSALNIDVGSGQQLTATVVPGNASNKAVYWLSSNPAVAAVDQNGFVCGIDDGTATITVRTVDGGKTATSVVTVRHPISDTRVTSVSITGTVSPIVIEEGATKHLSAEVLPNNARDKQVIWHTSNPNIVSVDQNGNITGVNEGTAIVTVTTVDGGKRDTSTVRVIPDTYWVGVTGINLNLVNTTIPVGFTDTVRYEIGPSNATDKDVGWSSSNPAVAEVNHSGRIEAKAVGTAVITATTVDGGKTASALVIVSPRVDPPSHGILLNKSASTMKVGEYDYPVVIFYPANENNYNLTWTSSNTGVATVDQNGRVLAKKPGVAVITVNTSNNRSASYVMIVMQ